MYLTGRHGRVHGCFHGQNASLVLRVEARSSRLYLRQRHSDECCM